MTACGLASATAMRQYVVQHRLTVVCLQEVWAATFPAWCRTAFPNDFAPVTTVAHRGVTGPGGRPGAG
jgi:hypothetical protein